MKNAQPLIEQAENIFAEKAGKGEFEIKEVKHSQNVIVAIEGYEFNLHLNARKKEVTPIGDIRSTVKLKLSEAQSRQAYTHISEELERQAYQRLKEKYEKQ